MNPKLSILVPAIPERIERLRAILTRCSLSMLLYNKKFPTESLTKEDVEFVIVDGGSFDETKDMCLAFSKAHTMKYIFLPIGKFINAGYPRNVGLRVCQGNVIAHLDVDHYPSENIIEGMLRPFFAGQAKGAINRGYVVDSSKSPKGVGPNVLWLEKLNSSLLGRDNLQCVIASAYKEAGIPPPGVNNTLWTWAIEHERIKKLNGYDETYCRKFAYTREDDDWRERLLASGMKFYDGHNQQFCAIHLWHPALWRDASSNELNKKYFQESCCPVKMVARNLGREWGKLLKYSFSIMEGKYREVEEHEDWIKENVEVPSYNLSQPWKTIEELVESLE